MNKKYSFILASLLIAVGLIENASALSYAPLQPFEAKVVNDVDIREYSPRIWKSKNFNCLKFSDCAVIVVSKKVFMDGLSPYYSGNDGYAYILGGRGLKINLSTSAGLVNASIYEAVIKGDELSLKIESPKLSSIKKADIKSIELIANPSPDDTNKYTIDSALLTSLPNGFGLDKLPIAHSDEKFGSIFLPYSNSVNKEADFSLPNIKTQCTAIASGNDCAIVQIMITNDSKYWDSPKQLLGRVVNLDTSSFDNINAAYGGTLSFIPFDYKTSDVSAGYAHTYEFYGQIIKNVSLTNAPVIQSPIALKLDSIITQYGSDLDIGNPPYTVGIQSANQGHALPIFNADNNESINIHNNESSFIVKQDWFSPRLKMSGSAFSFDQANYTAVIEIPKSDLGKFYAPSPDLLNGRELKFNDNLSSYAVVYDSFSYTKAIDGNSIEVIDLYVKLSSDQLLSEKDLVAKVIINEYPQLQSFYYANPLNIGANITSNTKMNLAKWTDKTKLPHFTAEQSKCPKTKEDQNDNTKPEGCFIINVSDLDKTSFAAFSANLKSINFDYKNFIFNPVTTTQDKSAVPYSMFRYQYDNSSHQYTTDYRAYNIYDYDQSSVYVARYSKQDIQSSNDAKEIECTDANPCLYFLTKNSSKKIVYDPDASATTK